MAIENLSDDLLMEILCRLPVKPLLRLKSVCKYWYALILNPNFVSLHHHRTASIAAAKNADCLLVKRFLNGGEGGVTLSFVPDQTPVEDIDISSTGLAHKNLQILGPCNGVVCLTLYATFSPIVLCNPSVKEFRLLPEQSYYKECMCNLGFGFDPRTNDYKVVTFFMTNSDIPISGVEVYDLSTDSWRKVDTKSPVVSGFTCHLEESSYTSWNGSFFWCADLGHGDAPVITSFSMSDEVFKAWPVPEVCLLDRHSGTKLLLLDNSLAMAIYPDPWSNSYFNKKSFDIWVMNEEDVEVWWTKKFTIEPFQGVSWAFGFRQNGEFLLETGYGQMVSYNLNTQERKAYQVHDQVRDWPRPPNIQALPYTASLVSVNRQS